MSATLALALSLTAPDVLSVDDDGPGPYFTIQAALDAASDGDVVLVEPGTYDEFIVEKDLTILGNGAPGTVIVGGWSSIRSGTWRWYQLTARRSSSVTEPVGSGSPSSSPRIISPARIEPQ